MTYDAIPPLMAARIFEAVHASPAIVWQVVSIEVINPIRYGWAMRGEGRGARICYLEDVEYVITAHFDLTDAATAEDHPGRHSGIFRRRALQGRSREPIDLGMPDHPAGFALADTGELRSGHGAQWPAAIDLGWMPYDDEGRPDAPRRYFRAQLEYGSLAVPRPSALDLVA